MSFILSETDNGTKRRLRETTRTTSRELNKNFVDAMKDYWYRVWQTARQLCIAYGAFETGTLYESIRLIWEYEPSGGLYEVAVSSRGVEVMAMIKVGGQEFINPKTGKPVNYAQAVHDGTRYMAERPFLMDAVMMNEDYLQEILQKAIDEGLSGFEREY